MALRILGTAAGIIAFLGCASGSAYCAWLAIKGRR
jgi:hypothetical protein